jgi:hypothetical protein
MLIRRVNTRVETRTEFKGGPSPRVPDSIFLPVARPCRHPLSQTTLVINPLFGIGPYLRDHHLVRVVPFNIANGNVIVFQSNSRAAGPGQQNRSTVRTGAPPSLSTLMKPITG